MFGLLRNLYKWYKNRNEKVVKFALLGIDNAGKTTILARLKGGMNRNVNNILFDEIRIL